MPMQCQPSSSRTLLPAAGMRYYCNIDSVKEIDTVLECVDITSPSPPKKKIKIARMHTHQRHSSTNQNEIRSLFTH